MLGHSETTRALTLTCSRRLAHGEALRSVESQNLETAELRSAAAPESEQAVARICVRKCSR